MKSWAGTGRAYADSYAALCVGAAAFVLGELGEARGRTLLDVGSGTGSLSSAFADAGWNVTGCEPEPSMREVAVRANPEIPVFDGALPQLPFQDRAFDAVVANFVLNHVTEPRRAARELSRVSADLVVATVWTNSPTWLWREVCDRAGLTPSAGERLPPDQDFARTVDGFARMLDDAGWTGTRVSEITWTWRAGIDALWVSAEGGVGGAGQYYRALDSSERAAFRAAFDSVCSERTVDGRVALEHSAALAIRSRC